MSIRAESLCWYLRGPMSMACLWDDCECVYLLVSIKLNLWKSRRPGKWFIGPGIQAVVSDGQRDHAVPVSSRGDPWMCMPLWILWIWSMVCVCFHSWSSASTREKGGRQLGCLYLCFIWGAVEEGGTLSVVVHAAGHTRTWDTCWALLLVEPAEKQQLCPTVWHRDLLIPGNPRAGIQQQDRRNSGAWSYWKQWPLLTSLNNWDAFAVNLWNK